MATTESTERTLSIAEVAHSSGLSAHTLRYYERTGLLEPVIRDGSGHRRYREVLGAEAIRYLTRPAASALVGIAVFIFPAACSYGGHCTAGSRGTATG